MAAYICERCPRIGTQFNSRTARGMAEHLAIHVARGDRVPPSAFVELEREAGNGEQVVGIHPFTEVHEAIASIDSFSGPPQEFKLLIAEVLLDPVGLHMALITDRVLARGWEPDGFEQASGYRIYRYKPLK